MRASKGFWAVLVVLVCVALVFLFKGVFHGASPVPSVDGQHRIKGSLNARVKILEYSDYQCPSCAKAAQIIDAAVRKYPDAVSVEHRHFPLPMHPMAFRAAIFAECAGVQGKFWAFHDTLFRSQASWVKMTNADPYFTDLAIGLGMDGMMLQACVASDAISDKIKADMAVGKTKGIEATPTFFIGDKRVVGSKNLEKELGELLTRGAQ
jgi:protein-disulfide isomerase